MKRDKRVSTILTLCQLMGGLVLSVGMVPQIIQLIKTKKANDLNRVSILTVLSGVAFMVVYAIGLNMQGVGLPILITNIASLVLQIILITTVLKYKKGYRALRVKLSPIDRSAMKTFLSRK